MIVVVMGEGTSRAASQWRKCETDAEVELDTGYNTSADEATRTSVT